jgi:hypothetical protein
MADIEALHEQCFEVAAAYLFSSAVWDESVVVNDLGISFSKNHSGSMPVTKFNPPRIEFATPPSLRGIGLPIRAVSSTSRNPGCKLYEQESGLLALRAGSGPVAGKVAIKRSIKMTQKLGKKWLCKALN